MKRRSLALLLLILVVALAFHHPIATNARALLLVSQEFPQVPVKPLAWVSREPEHRHLLLHSARGPVVADLFVPRPWVGAVQPHSDGAIILAFGVQVPQSARPSVLSFARALARLGYVVLWPRLERVDRSYDAIEEPETFVDAFTYLQTVKPVNREKISYLGISVGAPLALVAAADPRIDRKVHALVSFGGYFNVYDYLLSLATGRAQLGGREIAWQPSREAVRHVAAILKGRRAMTLLRIFRAKTEAAARRSLKVASKQEINGLRRFNPADHMRGFVARIFILHDRRDSFVPYVESEKLDRALARGVDRTFLLTDLFQHVEPGSGGLVELTSGILGLYGFMYEALDYL